MRWDEPSIRSHRLNSVLPKTAEVVRDATVTPTVIDRKTRTYRGCVYDTDGKVVPLSQRSNEIVAWQHTDPEVLPRGRARKLDRRAVYLGHYSGQYGHFLMETLSRFWVLLDAEPFETFIFQPFVHPMRRPSEFSPAKVTFECFGIEEDRVVYADRCFRVRELTVPSALCALHVGANEAQAVVYRRLASWCQTEYGSPVPGADPLRVYVSRTKFKGHRPLVNEEDVESMFSSLGFDVIHPEHMPFHDQVNIFSRAHVVAGLTGSAMHNSVFMPEGSLAISIGHHRRNNPAAPVTNQLICDKLAHVRSGFVPFQGELIDEETKQARIDVAYLQSEIERQL